MAHYFENGWEAKCPACKWWDDGETYQIQLYLLGANQYGKIYEIHCTECGAVHRQIVRRGKAVSGWKRLKKTVEMISIVPF